jgi:hypothetical protein
MEQKRGYPTAAALAMARAQRRLAVKYGDLGLAKRAKDLEARALRAIRMRQSYLPDETSASAKPLAKPELLAKKNEDGVCLPSEMDAIADSTHQQAREALEFLQKRELIKEGTLDGDFTAPRRLRPKPQVGNDLETAHGEDSINMSDNLSESAIVNAVSHEAAQRLTRKVIADLQAMRDTLSGDISGLKTTWDEICVQVQHQESIFWDDYDEIVRNMIGGYIAELAKYEREAIWMQTDAGIDWVCEEPKDRAAYPVVDADIINYLIHKYVYSEAADWSNARIEAYLHDPS